MPMTVGKIPATVGKNSNDSWQSTSNKFQQQLAKVKMTGAKNASHN